MVDPQQVEEWKRQYGLVYQVEDFIFRGLSIGEYKTINGQKLSTAEVEEQIAMYAILYPLDVSIDDLPAGIITAIAEEVIHISGVGDPKVAKALLEKKRAEFDNVFTLMKALIISAMPAYTEEYIDTLAFPILIEKVVLAERILGIKHSLLSGAQIELDLIDPEEEAARQKQRAEQHNSSRLPGQAVYEDPIADKLRQALR